MLCEVCRYNTWQRCTNK